MIPSVNNLLTTDLEVTTQPSKNYKMYIQDDVINGTCDSLNAMVQVIYKILNTERYMYAIYSWNYGIELRDLFGEPVSYVCAELERRITEALTQDERIESVSDFEFNTDKKHEVVCTFVVHTIFGDVETEKGVAY
jgi:hypothetical protein